MSKSIAKQISAFAANPASRELLLNDETMMKSLCQFLSNEDPETVLSALESFNAFCGNAEHRTKIAQLQGVISQLSVLTDYDSGAEGVINEQIRSYAKTIYEALSGKSGEEESQVRRATRGAYAVRGYIHQVTLSVPELKDDTQRALIESTLVNIKGLVSIVIDIPKRLINMGSTIKAADFQPCCIDALKAVGIHAEVPRDASKPTYINRAANKDALVRYTEAKPEKAKAGGGWLSGITSYFW